MTNITEHQSCKEKIFVQEEDNFESASFQQDVLKSYFFPIQYTAQWAKVGHIHYVVLGKIKMHIFFYSFAIYFVTKEDIFKI